MIKYVGEYEDITEYVVHDKWHTIKCYSVNDPIIVRYEKFRDFFLKKKVGRIRSVQIQYIPRGF
jgi:hypothetical protein